MKKMSRDLGIPCFLYDIDTEARDKADELVRKYGDWSDDYLIPQVFLEFDDKEFKHILTGSPKGVDFTKRAVEAFLKSQLYQSLNV
jgi:hypothetical protein